MKKNLKKDCKTKGFEWSGWIKPSNVSINNGYHVFGLDPKKGWVYFFIDKNGKKHKNAPR